MLIYAKKSGTPEKLHLYGTLGNVPSDSDNQLVYLKADGTVPSPAPAFPSTNNDYLYLDGQSGTIKWMKNGVDQGQLNVFIKDSDDINHAVIPQDFVLTWHYVFSNEGSDQGQAGTSISDAVNLMVGKQFNDGTTDFDVQGTDELKDSEGNVVTEFPTNETYPFEFTVYVWFTPEGETVAQNIGSLVLTSTEPQNNEEPET